MNLFHAWQLLVIAGWKNRIVRQIRRMKNPRYLIASLVGGMYFFWVFILQRRSVSGSAGPRFSAEFLPIVELLLVGFGAAAVLLAWIFGSDRATLAFTETEVQFLFPAPASRRQLLNFKLVRSLVRMIFSAGISALFFARNAAHPGYFVVGAFFGLSTLNLHVTAASFLRDALLRRGWSGFLRRAIPIVIFTSVLGFAIWAAWTRSPRPEWSSSDAVVSWARAFLETPPLSYVLWPIRVPVRLALAQDASEFLHGLPPAILLLALHYVWLLFSDVSFEEGAVESAEKRTRWVEARRGMAPGPKKGTRVASWKLKTTGPAEFGIIWKNVIAARRVFSIRVLPSLLILSGLLATSSLVLLPKRGGSGLFVLGFFCAIAALMLVIIGPASARIDLRHDLPQIDILRAWPLSGAQVMRGEVGGAALVLASLQWLLLLAAYGFTADWQVSGIGHREKLAALVGLMALCPSLSLAGLVVQNTAALIFPAWVALDPTQQRGVEVLGQRLVTLFGTWLVLFIAVIPAVIVGGGLGLLLSFPLGAWGMTIGALAAAAVLCAEAAAAIFMLGKAFDRFDVTEP